MRFVLALSFVAFASAAMAEPVLGMWQTQADRKGQIAYVKVQHCARALCGKIVKVFSPDGQQITHKNVGRTIFWDMMAQGGGRYAGRALVPAYNKQYDAQMRLSGNRLTVKGCLGPVCASQQWARVN